jgi:hypothetical protein
LIIGVVPSDNKGLVVFMLRYGRREEMKNRGNPTVVTPYGYHAECDDGMTGDLGRNQAF